MRKLFTLLTTLALLCVVGCEEQGDDNVNPNDKPNTEQPGEKPDDGSEIPDDAYISINKDILTFSPDGESIDIKVYSNYEWTLTNNCDWVTTSVTGGEASDAGTTVTLTADLTYDDRDGTITFSCGKAKKLLVVSQSFKEAIIADENNTFNLKGWAQSINIAYKTNVECEFIIPEEAQSWISLAPATRALVDESATLNIAENNTGAERSAVVKVVAANNKELVAEYTITQNQRYFMEYTSKDGSTVTPSDSSAFDATIIRNEYIDGKGYIDFDAPITSIGICAFDGCTSLTSVTIPDSVTEIGDSAFSDCTSLTSFYGKYASQDGRCLIVDDTLNSFAPAGLTEYTIPESVTEIGNWAFFNCDSLTSVTIPDSVTEIGAAAFSDCTSLTTVTIGNGITEIGDWAFIYCSSLTSITIPEDVTSIGDSAFYYCSSLTSVYCKATTPPTGGDDMFYHNASGRKIYVPVGSVEAYKTADGWSEYADAFVPYDFEKGEIVYSETQKIYYTSTDGNVVTPYATNVFGAKIISNTYADGQGVITFDGNVTKMEQSAFFGCSSLASITIPDGVTSIGGQAFYGCSGLANITIPDGVTSIGNYAFEDCSSLTSITIPDSVTSIGRYAFAYCPSLASITIPDSVTSIGEGAFHDCSSLTSITIPDSVTSIGRYAFSDCSSLASITIPDSVTSIGEWAFYGCDSLKSITIPEGVTSISPYAFSFCSSLAEVYCKPTTPPTAYLSGYSFWDAFDYNASDRKIYVPEESVEAYKTAEWWGDYADAIVGYSF